MTHINGQQRLGRTAKLQFITGSVRNEKLGSTASENQQPRAIVIDKLASYAAAKKDLIPGVAHYRARLLNNRAENSHQLWGANC